MINELDAGENTIIFWVAGSESLLSLGGTTGYSSGDLVYVEGGGVYELAIVIV